jgi:hypothetical protein
MFRAAAEDQAAWLKTEVLSELEHVAGVARSEQEEASQATVQWATLPPPKVGPENSCFVRKTTYDCPASVSNTLIVSCTSHLKVGDVSRLANLKTPCRHKRR